MISHAMVAGVPFNWVAGDTAYGVGDIERDLRRAGKGYVLGTDSVHVLRSWDKPRSVTGTAEEIAWLELNSTSWKIISDQRLTRARVVVSTTGRMRRGL
jgi:SRSO17 transposase